MFPKKINRGSIKTMVLDTGAHRKVYHTRHVKKATPQFLKPRTTPFSFGV